MCIEEGRSPWTFFIRDVKNGFFYLGILYQYLIYVMRNTAVFFCTRIVQIPVPRTVSIPFLNFEWSPEWESPDLMFHRTVLLLFGVFIIAQFLPPVNMANCKKCAFIFCRKSRNCNKCPIFIAFPLYKWKEVWYNKTVVGKAAPCFRAGRRCFFVG